MMKKEEILIAHKDEKGNPQTIKAHLMGTASLAKKFADEFECGDIAFLCGMAHDLGKYSEAYQMRIHNPDAVSKVDHSTAGAIELQKTNENFIPLGMVVAGHHSGLLDGGNRMTAYSGDGSYFGRCKKKLDDYSRWKEDLEKEFEEKCCIELPRWSGESRYSMSFFIRMIYSCLVDADYLDTETFMNHNNLSRGNYDSLDALWGNFEAHIRKWLEKENNKAPNNEAANHRKLCEFRNRILSECIEKGSKCTRGLYTLTVPTGGGKTTASLGFALKHACQQGLNRIIYVIPYTSVIDQNSAVFEGILGSKNVLEHHSGILYDIDEETSEEKQEEQYKKALATENWDAPIIVTTAVQFFESLYSNRSSKCRKLHNIANSIIIFDEAQTIPVPYLEPCVAAMAQLVKNYRSTIVVCTATQPALGERFQTYIPGYDLHEICSDTKELFEVFRRVQIKKLGALSMEELESRLHSQNQVLCIVNRRKTAQSLYQKLENDGVYCLTTLLCPCDRKEKFTEIAGRLRGGMPCKVIATSLIEAGVDLDFPQVYRQESALDSLIQAAGRCNREGKRPQAESVAYSFRIENEDNKFLAQNISALQETWREYDSVDTPEAIEFYFQKFRWLLGKENLDQKGIMRALENGINGNCFPFATVAREFKLIENSMRTIYGSSGIAVGENHPHAQ